ncbi:helix-turn-helix domain-containing protein [Actinacidiphila glaucinigra]|uniref:helix-turn-helix domain-containing protein n=1 Tax=Actinacidiphila glaucinigra TaxID=235986 RepID=UPI0036A128E4
MASEDEDRQGRLRTAGAWLRTQRELRGLTGTDLARRLDVNQVRISAYERGQYEVPSAIAEQLAAEFDLPVLTVRRELGLWVPSQADLTELQHYADPSTLADDILIGEIIRRYQQRTDREIVEVFPQRSQVPRELWTRLIDGARSEILLGGYTNYFFWTEHAHFSETLKRKAEDGVRVRILVGNPDHEVTQRREQVENAPFTVSTRIRMTLDELTKLGPIPGIETRFSNTNADAHVSRSIFRFDREALVSEHIADRLGHGSLTFHLKRLQDSGPFDQYVAHAEHLWDGGQSWNPN